LALTCKKGARDRRANRELFQLGIDGSHDEMASCASRDHDRLLGAEQVRNHQLELGLDLTARER
jgi:hypothetical protein